MELKLLLNAVATCLPFYDVSTSRAVLSMNCALTERVQWQVDTHVLEFSIVGTERRVAA